MATIPEPSPAISTAALIDAHHAIRGNSEEGRAHLGASLLGHPCDRWLWLSFRWAAREKFEGRMIRLFRRGHMEESTILADLRAIGCEISSTQPRVDFGAHVGGSVDAVIESGLPEAPASRHVAEFKTHNLKSFDRLVKDGVQKAKPEHWAQMQVYMHGTGIDRAVYIAVCKDDDRLHVERIKYDLAAATRIVERGRRIALSDRMPEPVSADPTWYQCRYCPGRSICHERKPTRSVACRTCAHATPMADSTWRCERWSATIPLDAQREGCDAHALHPDLVPWQLTDEGIDEWHAAFRLDDGGVVQNGENGTSSKDLVKR